MERMLLTPMEVREVLGIGRSLVYEMLASGQLPSIKLGRLVRVPSDALQRWITEHQHGGE